MIPLSGARKLRDLKATEVDAWLTDFRPLEHPHAAGDSVMSEPIRKAGHGAGRVGGTLSS